MIPCSKLTDRWGRKRCFTGRARALRHRRARERGLAEPRGADPRQLGARGRRHGAADPARLHPRDAVVRRHHLARLGVRRDQRARRHRRRGRAADRRRDHDRRSAGAPRSSSRRSSSAIDHAPEPQARAIRCRPTRRARSTRSARSSPAVGMFCIVFGILQAGTNNALLVDLPRRSARSSSPRSSSSSARRERSGQGAAALDRALQEPHVQPRARHAERPVAAADGHLVRRLGLPAGGARLQRDQDRRRSSPPRRSASSSRRSRRAAREAVRAADADRRGLRRHARRDRPPARARARLRRASGRSCRGSRSSASASARCSRRR